MFENIRKQGANKQGRQKLRNLKSEILNLELKNKKFYFFFWLRKFVGVGNAVVLSVTFLTCSINRKVVNFLGRRALDTGVKHIGKHKFAIRLPDERIHKFVFRLSWLSAVPAHVYSVGSITNEA